MATSTTFEIPTTNGKARYRCVLRPNREGPRRFTDKAAARVCCYAMANGASLQKIVALAEARCGGAERRPVVEEALAEAAVALQANNVELDNAFNLFRVVNNLLGVAATVLQLVPNPIVRIAGRGVVVARTQIAGQMGSIQAQRSANDRAYSIIQQAAANDRSFLLRVGAR